MNLLTIQKLNDGSIARSFLYYETEELALSALYFTMSSSLADANVNDVICILINDYGRQVKFEQWTREPEEISE